MKASDRAKKAAAHIKEISNRGDVHSEEGRWWSWKLLETMLTQELINGLLDERQAITRLREALHGLLGQWDGRDPETDGPVDIETSGMAIRKAQAVLSEVE